MTVEFLQTAAAELEDAVAYYNPQSEGLGYQLAVEMQKTLNCIAEFPEAWSLLSERTRRCRLRCFPYGVIYRVIDGTLLVIAVMHMHRHPDAWRDRVSRSHDDPNDEDDHVRDVGVATTSWGGLLLCPGARDVVW